LVRIIAVVFRQKRVVGGRIFDDEDAWYAAHRAINVLEVDVRVPGVLLLEVEIALLDVEAVHVRFHEDSIHDGHVVEAFVPALEGGSLRVVKSRRGAPQSQGEDVVLVDGCGGGGGVGRESREGDVAEHDLREVGIVGELDAVDDVVVVVDDGLVRHAPRDHGVWVHERLARQVVQPVHLPRLLRQPDHAYVLEHAPFVDVREAVVVEARDADAVIRQEQSPEVNVLVHVETYTLLVVTVGLGVLEQGHAIRTVPASVQLDSLD